MNVALQFLTRYGAGVAGGAAVAAVYSHLAGKTFKDGAIATAGGAGIGAVAGFAVVNVGQVFANVSAEDALNFARTHGAAALDKLVLLAGQIRYAGGAFLSQAGTSIGHLAATSKTFAVETGTVLYTKSVEVAGIGKAAFLALPTPVQVGVVLGLTALVVGGIALMIFNRKKAMEEASRKLDEKITNLSPNLDTTKDLVQLQEVKALFTVQPYTQEQADKIATLKTAFDQQTNRFIEEAQEIIDNIDVDNSTAEGAEGEVAKAEGFLALISAEQAEEDDVKAAIAAVKAKPAAAEGPQAIVAHNRTIADVKAEIEAKKEAEREAAAKTEKITAFANRINAIDVNTLTLENRDAPLALLKEIQAENILRGELTGELKAKLGQIKAKLDEIEDARPKTLEEQLKASNEDFTRLKTQVEALEAKLEKQEGRRFLKALYSEIGNLQEGLFVFKEYNAFRKAVEGYQLTYDRKILTLLNDLRDRFLKEEKDRLKNLEEQLTVQKPHERSSADLGKLHEMVKHLKDYGHDVHSKQLQEIFAVAEFRSKASSQFQAFELLRQEAIKGTLIQDDKKQEYAGYQLEVEKLDADDPLRDACAQLNAEGHFGIVV